MNIQFWPSPVMRTVGRETVRLRKSRVTAQEEITEMLNVGEIDNDYYGPPKAGDFDESRDISTYEKAFRAWATEVRKGLKEIFPTALEASYFVTQEVLPRLAYQGITQRVGELRRR